MASGPEIFLHERVNGKMIKIIIECDHQLAGLYIVLKMETENSVEKVHVRKAVNYLYGLKKYWYCRATRIKFSAVFVIFVSGVNGGRAGPGTHVHTK